ncbi:MAG: TonB family protein [Chthoniobacterales bacterium]
MRRNRSFWRNVAIIGALHLAVIIGLTRWGDRAQKRTPVNITWMDSAVAAAIPSETPANIPSEATVAPTPEEQPTVPPAEETPAPTVAAPSDIPLATPTPQPTSTPIPKSKPTATPTPRAKESAKPKSKPTPKATPKKKRSTKKAKATPTLKKSAEKKSTPTKAPAPKKVAAKKWTAAAQTSGAGNRSSGAGSAAQASWYGDMLHDRFFRAWVQPTSVVSTGVKMSALVRIRIEADGLVSAFEIVRSSGNVVVDQSVKEIAQRVTRVDPLPAGVGQSGHYDVKINFQLGLTQ